MYLPHHWALPNLSTQKKSLGSWALAIRVVVPKPTFRGAITVKTVVQIRPRVGPNTKGTLADVKVAEMLDFAFIAIASY